MSAPFPDETRLPAQASENSELADQSLAGVRWLAFDAVGTLIHPEPSVAVAYHEIGRRYGSRLNVTEIGSRFRSLFQRSEREGFPGGPSPEEPWISSPLIEEGRWRWIVANVLDDVIDLRENCFQDLWEHFGKPSAWRSFADVNESLIELANAGYGIAIASNFDSRLHSVCDGLKELQSVTRRVISAEVGFRKPNPSFYEALANICSCQPYQILMIGDDPEHDFVGPGRSGIPALLIDRTLATSEPTHIKSLSELVARLNP